ncbi:MAG TPA: hypothetical protein DCF91_12215 [Porphyromonadaceae bacterium]|nr:hypothetical protein [Porphyromonadaceae bacterium]
MFTNTSTAQLEYRVLQVECAPVVAVKSSLAELTNARRKHLKHYDGKMKQQKRSLCNKLQKSVR